jgi:hypothetical protein
VWWLEAVAAGFSHPAPAVQVNPHRVPRPHLSPEGGRRYAQLRAHAWVEAEGKPVDEPHPGGYYRPVRSVPPVETGH